MEKLSKFELARLVGSRALQIAMGAPFLIKLSETDLEKLSYNPIRIAQLELEKDMIPITVKRPDIIIHEELPEISEQDLPEKEMEKE